MSSVGARTRRVPPLVQRGAAGVVERQAQAEADAGLDLAHALEDLLGGEQVDAAELVVVAPVAPGRAVRALRPPLRHRRPPRLYRPVGLRSERYSTAAGIARAGGLRMTDKQRLRRLGRRAPPRADRPVQHPPPEAPARPRRSGRRTSRSSRSSRAAPRVFRRLHTPGFEGWTISRYRQTGGRTPEGDPEIILEDMDLDGVDAAGDAPEPVAVRALLRRPRAVDGARARLQRLRHRAVHAVLRSRSRPPRPIPLTDIDDAVAEIERVAAAGFRAILLPATPPKPYYSRDFDPVWAAAAGQRRAACSSTPRPAA